MSDFVTRKEWGDLWEEFSTVKALIQEWPHGPCAKQVENVSKHFSARVEKLESDTSILIKSMQESIQQIRQDAFTTKQRALETQKQALASVNRANDHLKEYESRISMLQEANRKLMAQWDSVLKTIGYKLEFVPAKYEVQKLDSEG